MKNHLVGFGIIMTVGLAIALIGSNPASSLLASLFTVTTGTLVQTTSTTSTTNTDPGTTTTSDAVSTTTTATSSVAIPAQDGTTTMTATTTESQVVVERPMIAGVQNGDVVSGVRSAAVRVFGSPVAVRAELTLPDGMIQPIYPQCPTAAPSMLIGTIAASNCYFSIDTATIRDGQGYRLRGFAKYLDGSLLSTDIVEFAIVNASAVEFVFAYPVAYEKVLGDVTIQGKMISAVSVGYEIFESGNTATPVVVGVARSMDGLWVYTWNTRTVKNGNFVIVPQIANQYGTTYKGKSLVITVHNAVASDSVPLTTEPALTDLQPTAESQTRPIVDAKEPVVASEPTVTQSTVAPTQEAGFFENVRTLFRSAVNPQEERVSEVPKPVVVPGAAVQHLEQVVAELKAASQNGNVISQAALDRIAKDTDNDDIPDYQEAEVLRTDPLKKDTDGDGIIDGLEVRQGTNPLSADRTIKIQYENAKLLGETVRPEILKINGVALATTTETVEVSVATKTATGTVKMVKEKKKVVKEKIRFTGKALPYALVTIYVYSDIPTIVTVKADKNGNWSYSLAKPLDDGQHQAYVTINDSTGKIVAKSQMLGFVKTAQAITVANMEGLTQASEGELAEPVETSKRNFGIIVALVIGLGLLIGIFMVVQSFKKPEDGII